MSLNTTLNSRCIHGCARLDDRLVQGRSTVRRASKHRSVKSVASHDGETSRRFLLTAGASTAALLSLPGGEVFHFQATDLGDLQSLNSLLMQSKLLTTVEMIS